MYKCIITFLFTLIISCALDRVSGTTDETETGTKMAQISGIITSMDIPADSVVIELYNTDQDSIAAPAAETVTDRNGTFIIDSLKTGIYNLFGKSYSQSDTMVLFLGQIQADSSEKDIGTHNLSLPGLIQGNAVVNETSRKDSILCGISGSPYWSFTDTSGNYSLPQVPSGIFNVILRKMTSTITFPKVTVLPESAVVLDTIEVETDTVNIDSVLNLSDDEKTSTFTIEGPTRFFISAQSNNLINNTIIISKEPKTYVLLKASIEGCGTVVIGRGVWGDNFPVKDENGDGRITFIIIPDQQATVNFDWFP